MTAPQQHRIQRQVIELQGCPRGEVQALQAAVATLLQRDWLPAIERLCSALGDPARVQRLERLEIDLGALPPQALLAAQRGDSAAAAPAGQLAQRLQALLAPRLAQALATAAEVRVEHELMAHFLQTGHLPWWADASDRQQVQRAAQALLQQPAAPWRLLAAGGGAAVAAQRLAASLDDALLAALLRRLLPEVLQAAPDAIRAAPAQPAANLWPAALDAAWRQALAAAAAALGLGLQQLRQAWWQAALAAALQAPATGPGPGGPAPGAGARGAGPATNPAANPAATAPHTLATWLPGVLAGMAQRLGLAPTGLAQALRRALDQAGRGPAGDVMLLAPLWQALASADAATPASGPGGPGLPGVGAGSPAGPGLWRPPGSTPPPASEAAAPAPWLHLAAPDALYLANAGLVLLWPFLPRFVDRLGLLQSPGHWRDEAAAQRAARLLQCVASGDEDAPEYLLPLNKLLCGLALQAPLAPAEPISADERAECEALISAAVAQAPVLRQMSVAGFRGSFLLRNGQLSARDGHALLRVERQAWDLLIAQFPWSAALVRLPWMPALLRVEW